MTLYYRGVIEKPNGKRFYMRPRRGQIRLAREMASDARFILDPQKYVLEGICPPGLNEFDKFAAEFDGVDDYIKFTSPPFPDSTITIEIYMKIESSTFGQVVGCVGRRPVIQNYPSGSGLQLLHNNIGGSPKYIYDGTFVSRYLNSWSHVVFQIIPDTNNNQTTLKIVEDGGAYTKESIFTGLPDTVAFTRIGIIDGSYFNGKIAVVRVYNRALSADEISQNYNAVINGNCQDVVKDGLVLWLEPWYHEDDTIFDRSGNGNDGTAYGGVKLPKTHIIPVGSYLHVYQNQNSSFGASFDGIDDYVEVPDDASLDLTEFSIEVWIKTPNPTKDYQMIIAKADSGGTTSNYELRFYQTTGVVELWSYNQNYYARGGTVLNANEWYHIVAIATASSWKIYINGVDDTVTSSSGTPTTNDYSLQIGARQSNYCFDGSIAFVRIYNRALSESEIQQNYNSIINNDPDDVVKDGLVLWLNLWDHQNNIIPDWSGNGNDGTAYGGVTFPKKIFYGRIIDAELTTR